MTKTNENLRTKLAEIRAAKREIKIPPVKNRYRRNRCAADAALFCRTYLDHIFYYEFTDDQLTVISSIVTRIKRGGKVAIASPRASGKSSITRAVALWAVLNGYSKFIVLVSANAHDARDALSDIKSLVETSDVLCEDYPEVCVPVRELSGAVQRCRTQAYKGQLTRLQWSSDQITFPKIGKRGKAASSIIRSIGIDGAIRGMIQDGKRPDLVLIDDCETRESASSSVQTKQRRKIIESDIMGLAGKNKPIAVFLLGTIIRRDCLADEFTDRKRKPAWSGIRQKLLIRKPEDEAMWTKYVELRQADQLDGDETGRTAHQFYLDNMAAMSLGVVISDTSRFDPKLEVDALEHIYNLIADIGWDNFASEYQNEPPEDDEAETSGLNVAIICKKISGLERGFVPDWAQCVTAGIDIGGRQIYYVVAAWGAGARGTVLDYGTQQVHSPVTGKLTDEVNREAVERAILTALVEWRDIQLESGYVLKQTGEARNLDGCLVDSGWQSDVVYNFAKASAGGIYLPAKGWGSGKGSKYRQPRNKTRTIRPGNHLYQSWIGQSNVWLVNLDSDYFKLAVQNAFLAPSDQPGSLSLFGDNPVVHRGLADHITAEVWTREFVPGKGVKEFFDIRSKENHLLDAAALARAAAALMGITILPGAGPDQATKKIKLSEVQAARRGR